MVLKQIRQLLQKKEPTPTESQAYIKEYIETARFKHRLENYKKQEREDFLYGS